MTKQYILFLCCTILLCHFSFGQQAYERLYPFKKDGLYGFIDSKGKIIVEPQYHQVGRFSEGLCAVVERKNKESKLGYINHKGELVIGLQYQYYLNDGSDFSEGRAVVRLNEQSGYINREGEMIFPPTLYKGHPFKGEYAVIEEEYSVRKVINKKGEILFEPREAYRKQMTQEPRGRQTLYLSDHVSDDAITFSLTDYSTSPSTSQSGYFDMDGTIHFLDQRLFGSFCNGRAKAYNENGSRVGYVNKKGEVVIPYQFIRGTEFHNGKARVRDAKTKKYGIIDTNGRYLIDPKYYYISNYFYKDDDIILVTNDPHSYDFVTSTGEPLTQAGYNLAADFSEGLALVKTKEKVHGFIDKTGKPAFELDFDTPPAFRGGVFKGELAWVKIDKQFAYINKEGEVVFRY
ncbi:MAG: WG repeat-containing protein [Bacteroidota bacterium]